MPPTIFPVNHRVARAFFVDIPSLAASADPARRINHSQQAPLAAGSMKTVGNPPGAQLSKAVAAIVGDGFAADRIACELAMAEVSATELDTLLDRAIGRDALTNFARHALRDGFPSSLVTLALNLWGFEGLSELTGDTAAAASLYGASLGSAIVVLDEVFRHMFEGMTYTPAELATAIPATPYFMATTIPLTLRNVVRAISRVSLVLAGKSQWVANVDNGIELAGGILASVTTGHAMERLSLPGMRERLEGVLMREDLGCIIGQLRDGPCAHMGRVARQAAFAALCGVRDVPAGVCRLATPVGVITVATLAAFVPAALAAMGSAQRTVHDDTPAVPEAAAELARTGVLFAAYVLLAGANRYAAPAFSRAASALRSIGSTSLTSTSRSASGPFTWLPGWYGFPKKRDFHA